MDNIFDENMPFIFQCMINFAKNIGKDFLGDYEEKRYKTKTELYKVLGGRNGGRRKIIKTLQEFGLIKTDENGIYYDVKLAYKMLKKSELYRVH